MKICSFESFISVVEENIKSYLPREFSDANISISNVIKNNDVKLTALLVKREHDTIVPNIYLEQYYDLLDDCTYEEVLNTIAYNYVMAQTESFGSPDELLDISKVVFQVVNLEANKDRLENAPYIKYLDLAICFKVLVSRSEEGIGTILVNNDILKQFDKNSDELYEIAMKNTTRLFPATFQDMDDKLKEMIAEMQGIAPELVDLTEFRCGEDTQKLYLVSNESCQYGAAVLLYPEYLHSISTTLGKNLYILPSSIHECLILCDTQQDQNELSSIVQNVNNESGTVPFEDVLSNHVYYYDKDEKKLSIAC